MAMLLSSFGVTKTPEQIAIEMPVSRSSHGEEFGSINQQLATWCIDQGFEVDLYSADFQVIDLSWADLRPEQLLERMDAATGKHIIPALGDEFSNIYLQSYIDFVRAGGRLHIRAYMSSEILDNTLKESPLLACVSYNVLYNIGRTHEFDPQNTGPDDINGKVVNHSIVIYGKDDAGNYLIADPRYKPGRHTIEPKRLLAAMGAAEVECDNLFFRLRK